MNAQPKNHDKSAYESALSAWRELVFKGRDPRLKRRLLREERELLPRFAAHYARLAALPRPTRRIMQRNWKRSIASLALMLAMSSASAMAATINVGIKCNLIDAITAANTDMQISGCESGSGADTIVLPAGSTQTLTAANNTNSFGGYDGDNGLPVVTSAITIEGNGAAIKRAGTAPEFRIFALDDGAKLTLKRTIVTGGKVSNAAGGGVINGGSFILNGSTVSDNSVGGGYYGGGVFNAAGSSVTITNSTVSGNSSESSGGGITSGGALTVTNSTISANTASTDGGGIHITSDSSIVTNSTISGNSASQGGAMFIGAANLKLTNSTITRNTASESGGGIDTFLGEVTLEKTLISGNNSSQAREARRGYQASITANNFNVFGFSGNAGVSGFTPGAKDIVPSVTLAQVLNTTLANNGGSTRTHALVSGSPAVDAVGSACPPPSTDQRGVKRPQGAKCDTGSFELEGGGGTPPPQDGRCAGKIVTIMGTELRDNLRGTNRADVIQGLGGNDTIFGLGGNDTICGGNGKDTLHGGPGDDLVQGNNGDDLLNGNDGKDRLDGGAGRDVCDGGPPSRGDTAKRCERVRNVP